MEGDSGIEKEIIPFLPSSDKQTPQFLEVKYSIANTQFKKQLPIFKGGSAKELLYFLHEFTSAKSKLGYNSYQKLESGLEQLLQSTALSAWNTIKGTVEPNVNTIHTFNLRIEALKRIYIPEPAAIENQKAHLQRAKKNDRLTVPLFLDRLRQLNLLLPQFPNGSSEDSFTPEKLKRIFYFAMPLRWRTNFINSGQSLHESSLEVIKTYMIHQEHQTDAHRRKTRDANSKKQSSSSSSRRNPNSNPKGKPSQGGNSTPPHSTARTTATMRPPSQVFYNQDAQSQSHRSIDSTKYQASYQGTPNNPEGTCQSQV